MIYLSGSAHHLVNLLGQEGLATLYSPAQGGKPDLGEVAGQTDSSACVHDDRWPGRSASHAFQGAWDVGRFHIRTGCSPLPCLARPGRHRQFVKWANINIWRPMEEQANESSDAAND